MDITIYKAQPTGERETISVHIHIVEPFPDLSVTESCARHELDAATLATGLWTALPGGTLDHLLAEMMRRTASRLRVARPLTEASLAAVTDIAYDNRTGHHWHHREGDRKPSCAKCKLWMTDWSLINECGLTLEAEG